MSMKMRTVLNLLRNDEYVYVYLNGDNVKKRFLQDAEQEGFTVGKDTRPTEIKADSIMVVRPDMTICYAGYVGHLCYLHGKENHYKKVVRIDYMKYIAGAKNYVIKRRDAVC